MKKKHYAAIDGLRMIAALGIVVMHINSNNTYEISGFLYNTIIPSFTDFVFLFMVISSFGMCCGYYDKVHSNQINMSEFYGSRFKKILPFFGFLVLIDIMLSPSINTIFEGFADLTLLFGFLPNSISVIGVGWFIGLVFIFYLIFPFFCVLIENKKRALIIFVISIIYNIACTYYFNVGRTNILYSGCFFLAGGVIYLYRDKLVKFNKYNILVLTVLSIVIYYGFNKNSILSLIVSSLLLIYAINNNNKLLNNKLTNFFSGISMEIYLSHMVIFRLIEKLNINYLFGKGWGQYVFTCLVVIFGATLFSVIVKKIIDKLIYILRKEKVHENINDKQISLS